MMKYVTVALLIASIVNAKPQGGQSQGTTPVPIISQQDSVNPDGSYTYSFESGDGTKVQNTGTLKQVTVPRYEGDGLGPNDPPRQENIVVQSGSYSYTAPDGSVITINYVADENGFQPQGPSIPTVPSAIPAGGQQQPQGRSLSHASEAAPVVKPRVSVDATTAESTSTTTLTTTQSAEVPNPSEALPSETIVNESLSENNESLKTNEEPVDV